MALESAPLSSEDLVGSPAWFPLDVVAPQAVRLVRLDEAAYRDSSFLDQRLLHAGHARAVLAPVLLQRAAAQLAPRLHYIFHIGHVGSTLVSRLLGAHEQLFALREPALLRALADGTLNAQLPAAELSMRDILALLARTWRPGQRCVVKVSSFVSELAEPLLGSSEQAAAIFMFVEPLTYLRTIFAGANSRAESRLLAPLRVQRLVRRLGAGEWRCDPRSEGEQVAMSWLCEMACLQQAAAARAAEILWVDFDQFLASPRAVLQGMFGRLGVQPAPAQIDALLAGPIMQTYSKAPEHAYDAQLRRELLQEADRDHGAEIRRALEWLRFVAGQHPAARAVLESLAGLRSPALSL